MATDRSSRKYDILVVGATGYTGKLAAEHIALHLPTDLSWALVGRSKEKLDALAAALKKVKPTRRDPDTITVDLTDGAQLRQLIGQTKVCVSVVQYGEVGEYVVEACIDSKTDYVDTMGDTPLAKSWVDKYHKRAEEAGIYIMPFDGFASAPYDLMTWALVHELAEKTSKKTYEVILSIKQAMLVPSGGTLKSMISRMGKPLAVDGTKDPWFLSPVKGTPVRPRTDCFGMRQDPILGSLSSTSYGDIQNRDVIHRTWGLLGKSYGENFQYNQYEALSTFAGLIRQVVRYVQIAALTSAPLRAVAMNFLPAPGEGPDPEEMKKTQVELEGVAIAEATGGEKPARSFASLLFPAGGPYTFTGFTLALGAASLLYTRKVQGNLRGGLITPAMLGQDLLDRYQAAGVKFSVSIL